MRLTKTKVELVKDIITKKGYNQNVVPKHITKMYYWNSLSKQLLKCTTKIDYWMCYHIENNQNTNLPKNGYSGNY